MCHDGTGLRCERAEARLLGVMTENGPPQTALGATIGAHPDRSYPGKSTNLCWHRRSAPGAWRRAKSRRSGSKSGSGRWSHWDEIGWVHYPEIGWSHSDEIRGVQSLEILHVRAAFQVDLMHQIVDCRQHDLRREWQRRHHGPRRDGAVVRSVRYAAPHVVEELPLDAVHLDGVGTGAVARGDPPAIFAIARELERIVDRVPLLHIGCAAGVLEIVDAFVAHERVLNAAKVDPDMRNLMREQRPRVKIVVSVTVFPLVGGSPRGVAALRQRMSGRAESQDIQHQRLVVAFPAPFQESAFGFPPVRDRSATILRPSPVSAAIERVGKGAYFLFLGRIRVKIRARRQRTGEQNGAVHRRQFALPGAPAGLHVEKMIIEAVVAGSVRLGALPAVPEKSQCGEDRLDRRCARDEAALDRDRIRRQGEPGGRNAGGPIGRGLVEHQPILRIGLVQKVAEGLALKGFQLGIDRRVYRRSWPHAALGCDCSATAPRHRVGWSDYRNPTFGGLASQW